MNYMNWGAFGMGPAAFGSFLLIAILWNIVWKGLALWRAGRLGHKWWFIVMLVLNTFGILEIIYLFAISGAKLSDFAGAPAKSVETPPQQSM
ncbi:MAG TPA: DUF5652 family protein [Candidatus Paceibacterota bacterium]|jgi:hypothetical protein|nr:DUF5652 family protein [Candidatus Paceibacterota bacterium]